jgi:hypothetical protein
LVKDSGQGGGFVSCSPKYIIKKLFFGTHNGRDVELELLHVALVEEFVSHQLGQL